MSFADDLAANTPLEVPREWQRRSVWDGEQGEIVTGPIAGDPLTDFSEILTKFGYDPELVEIVGKVNQWKKERPDGTWLTSYFFGVQSKRAAHDLPALYAAAAKRPRKPYVAAQSGRTSVPVIADVQAGKTGSRGGTPELIDRLQEKREKLAAELKRRKPADVVLPDINDLFENFESGGNPMFTNDLSLAQQMDLAATEIYRFVELAARHGRVLVPVVPSNHTAWRRGKQQLGRPGDDLGIFVHRQVEKVAHAAGLDAHWVFPDQWDESLVFDVRGTRVGMAHGNQFRPSKAVEWWAKQQHGGQPVGSADILITGHYHHLSILPTGRNPYTGRSKWWLQAPTLDNGSDWFRNLAGDDSDPGLLLFDITDEGFDLQSLTVL